MKYLSILFAITLLIACQNKAPKKQTKKNVKPKIEYPITIDFENNFDKFKEVKLSEIADSIEYIKLENQLKCFIKRPFDIHISDEYIFVAQYNSMLQFDRAGKFIRQIGKQGRGPKEYAHVYDARIDHTNKLVYINAGESRKIICFNFDGNYIKTFKYFSNIRFDMLDSTRVVSDINNHYGQEKYKMLITNETMDTLGYLKNHVTFPIQERTVTISGFDRRFYHFDDKLHFMAQYGDTVFQINSTTDIKPKYIINKGKYKLPVNYRIERIQDYKKYISKATNYYLTNAQEIKNHLLVNYENANRQENEKIAIYDKKTNEFYSVGNPASKLNGFTNDLIGIGSYLFDNVECEKYLLFYSSAINFLETNEKIIEQIKSNQNTDQIAKYYCDFVKSIKEDDNFILQIVHLKK
jgi:hypothetical protein